MDMEWNTVTDEHTVEARVDLILLRVVPDVSHSNARGRRYAASVVSSDGRMLHHANNISTMAAARRYCESHYAALLRTMAALN